MLLPIGESRPPPQCVLNNSTTLWVLVAQKTLSHSLSVQQVPPDDIDPDPLPVHIICISHYSPRQQLQLLVRVSACGTLQETVVSTICNYTLYMVSAMHVMVGQ